MFKAFSTREGRIRSFIMLGLASVFATIAAIIGISDNPAGILLSFLAAASLLLAFIHHWRTSKQFLYFLIASIAGFIVFVMLAEGSEALASKADPGFLKGLIEGVGTVSFFIAILACPAGIITGLVGMLVFLTREDKGKKAGPMAK